MNMRRLLFLVCSVVFLALAGCNGEEAGCWTPLGEEATQVVSLDMPIETVQILDRINVEWSPVVGPDAPRLVWTAGEGVMGGMSAGSANGVLLIQDLNACRWVRPLHAIPHLRIEGVECRDWLLEGQGTFTMVDTLIGGDLKLTGDEMSGPAHLLFNGDTLQVRMPNGIGHVEAKGRARRLRAFRAGFGDLNARDLAVRQAMVHHGGLGEVQLNASDYLYLEVAGPGHTFLYGETEDANIQLLDGATGTVTDVP